MPVVPWSKGPGPTGIRPRSVGTCNCAWKSSPQRSRPSVGRPRSGCANGIASCMATGKHANQVVVAIARELRAFMWAIAKQGAGDTASIKTAAWLTHKACRGFQRLSEEAQPRCGVTLGGVKRPQGTLVPRVRQAPDGCK